MEVVVGGPVLVDVVQQGFAVVEEVVELDVVELEVVELEVVELEVVVVAVEHPFVTRVHT